jgi:hypothetical protein
MSTLQTSSATRAALAVTLLGLLNNANADRVGTGFGVNEFRNFSTNAATQYNIDGDPIVGDPTLAQIPPGASVFAILGADASATVSTGTATNVFIDTQLRGAVSGTNPLRVLGQSFTVDAGTILANLPAGGIAGLSNGNVLEVYGQVDPGNNSLIATRVELKQTAPVWRLTGFVTAVSATTINVGTQVINLSVLPQDCGAAIAVGKYVEVRLPAISPYVAGQVISNADRIHCGTPTPPGTVGAPDWAISMTSPPVCA